MSKDCSVWKGIAERLQIWRVDWVKRYASSGRWTSYDPHIRQSSLFWREHTMAAMLYASSSVFSGDSGCEGRGMRHPTILPGTLHWHTMECDCSARVHVNSEEIVDIVFPKLLR